MIMRGAVSAGGGRLPRPPSRPTGRRPPTTETDGGGGRHWLAAACGPAGQTLQGRWWALREERLPLWGVGSGMVPERSLHSVERYFIDAEAGYMPIKRPISLT